MVIDEVQTHALKFWRDDRKVTFHAHAVCRSITDPHAHLRDRIPHKTNVPRHTKDRGVHARFNETHRDLVKRNTVRILVGSCYRVIHVDWGCPDTRRTHHDESQLGAWLYNTMR